MSFISFSGLIALARTSSAILNSRGKNGSLCVIPDRGGKLPVEYDVSYQLVILTCRGTFLLYLTCWEIFVFMKRAWILSEAFSASVDHVILSFLHLIGCFWFTHAESSFHGDKSHLRVGFDYCAIRLLVFPEDFCIYAYQWYWPVIFFAYIVFVWLWY